MIAEISIKKDKKKVYTQYTLKEYFELEEKALYKSEFINGKIIPMAGGTYNHNIISSTILGLLFMILNKSEKDFYLFGSDQTIYIDSSNRVVYPDTCVLIDKPQFSDNQSYGITNPTFIVEVASKSTEKYDRKGKFRLYQSLPSFKEYVLVSQDTPVVEVFYKLSENKWQMTTYIDLDKTVELETLGVSLKMSAIYKQATELKDPQSIIEFPEE